MGKLYAHEEQNDNKLQLVEFQKQLKMKFMWYQTVDFKKIYLAILALTLSKYTEIKH